MKCLFLLFVLPVCGVAQVSERSVFRNGPLGDSAKTYNNHYPNDSLQIALTGDTLFLSCFRSNKLHYRQPYAIVCGARYGDDRVFQCELYHSSCLLFLYGAKPDSVKRDIGNHTQVFSGNIASGQMSEAFMPFDSLDRSVSLGYIGRRTERTLLHDPQAGYEGQESDIRMCFFVFVNREGKVTEIKFNRYASTSMREEHFQQAEAYFKQLRYAPSEKLSPDYVGSKTFCIPAASE